MKLDPELREKVIAAKNRNYKPHKSKKFQIIKASVLGIGSLLLVGLVIAGGYGIYMLADSASNPRPAAQRQNIDPGIFAARAENLKAEINAANALLKHETDPVKRRILYETIDRANRDRESNLRSWDANREPVSGGEILGMIFIVFLAIVFFAALVGKK